MLIFVPDGPLLKKGAKFNASMVIEIFKDWNYTQASLGYYGHMWEQYSFWGFLPLMIGTFAEVHKMTFVNVSVATFFAISAGAIGSFITGWGTKYITSSFTAGFHISASAFCGIIHPIFYGYPSFFLYMCHLVVWGWAVTADSPQFSALASRACKPELLGTALTVYNCIGYFMTVISIQLCEGLAKYISMQYVSVIIALGPIVGACIIAPRAKKEGMWLIPEIRRRTSTTELKPIMSVVEEQSKPSMPAYVQFDIGSAEEPETVALSNPVQDADLIGRRLSV